MRGAGSFKFRDFKAVFVNIFLLSQWQGNFLSPLKILIRFYRQWFFGKDACMISGVQKKKKTLQKKTNEKPIKLPDIVCDLGKSSQTPISHNDIKAVYIVNPSLNQLIFSSRLEATENFGCWVFKNVHPSICKTGKGLKYCSKVSNKLCFCSRHTCGLMK